MSNPNGKKSEPRLDLDRTREKLARLGLEHVAELLEDKLSAAARDEIPPYRFLEEILDDELGSREERRIRTSLRLSGIPPGMTLGNFDFSFQPAVSGPDPEAPLPRRSLLPAGGSLVFPSPSKERGAPPSPTPGGRSAADANPQDYVSRYLVEVRVA